ncbi:hypothetical protein ACFQ6V_09280 [Streptomyces roseifaciens]
MLRHRAILPLAPSAAWLIKAARLPDTVAHAWRKGRCADLTAGTSWDLVELPFETGRKAMAVLDEQHFHIGPYLLSGIDRAMWVMLPLGTAHRLSGAPDVIVRPPGWQLRAPAPGRYSDRLWLPPSGGRKPELTNTGALLAALHELARRPVVRCQ